MGQAEITAANNAFMAKLNAQYPSLGTLNSVSLAEMCSRAPIEPVPLAAELYSSNRFAVAAASLAESFSPSGPNSGRGGIVLS